MLVTGLAWGQSALTVYNQNFAVVRDVVRLNLQPGDNRIRYDEATAMLEPGSVILRDRAGRTAMAIREQSYQSLPVSLASQLKDYEGGRLISWCGKADSRGSRRAGSFALEPRPCSRSSSGRAS